MKNCGVNKLTQQNLFGQVIVPDRKTFTKVTLDEDGEPQVNPEPSGADPDGTVDTGLEDCEETYWNDFTKWSEACKKNTESFAYLRLGFIGDLQQQAIDVRSGLERIWRGTSESYGGMWGGSSYTDMKELRDEIIEFFTHHLKRPYNRELADEWVIRGIKRENIRVWYNDKVREFILEKGGWDIVELLKEIDAWPERPYDPDFQLLLKEYNDTKNALADTKDKKWKVDKQLQRYTDSYSNIEEDGDVIKGFYEQRKKLKKDEQLLEIKEQELREKLVSS